MKVNRDQNRKTSLQWQKVGRLVNDGATGEECWTNRYYQHKAIYYHIDDTHIATVEELKAAREPFLAEKRERERERRAEEKEQMEKEKAHRIKVENARSQFDASMKLPVIPCLNPSKAVVFDLEMTGLDPYNDEILQFSAIDGDGNVLLNAYIKPYVKEEWPNAQAINRISPEMVQDAPQLHELIPKIRGIFESAEMLITYNGDFDMAFLNGCGIDFNSKKHVDVMHEFAPIFGDWDEYHEDYKWKKLTECAAYYGLEFRAHDALEDCKATLYCYRAIRKEGQR